MCDECIDRLNLLEKEIEDAWKERQRKVFSLDNEFVAFNINKRLKRELIMNNCPTKPKIDKTILGCCPHCGSENITKNKCDIKYCENCNKDILSPAQSLAQEICDYLGDEMEDGV